MRPSEAIRLGAMTSERLADWIEEIKRERGLWPEMEIALEPCDVVRLAEKLGVEI